MSLAGFIFSEDLKIQWADIGDLIHLIDTGKLEGKSIQDLFKKDRDLSTVVRWVMSEKTLKLKGQLTSASKNEKVLIEVIRSGKNFHLFLSKSAVKSGNQFSKLFWNVFSQTFPGGLVFVAEDMKIVEISHMLLSVLKVKNQDDISLSKNAVLGRSLDFLFKDGQEDDVYKLIASEIEKTKLMRSITKHEGTYGDKDLRIICGAVYDGESYSGSCIYIFDISEEVKKNAKIKDQELMLFQSARLASLGEMAGGIAHEINNPLAIISSSMKVLKKASDKKKLNDALLAEIVQDVEITIQRAIKIISGLRTVCRDSTGNDIGSIVLRELFSDVAGLCSERFKNHGVRLDLDLDLSVYDDRIIGDRVQLSQVFINLLSNSYDAIEELDDKWIRVEISTDGDFQVIKVIDSGKRIDNAIQDKMFNPFFTSKAIGKGTGLGLSISKTIVAKSGGTLEIDNTIPNTCFVVKLLKDKKEVIL